MGRVFARSRNRPGRPCGTPERQHLRGRDHGGDRGAHRHRNRRRAGEAQAGIDREHREVRDPAQIPRRAARRGAHGRGAQDASRVRGHGHEDSEAGRAAPGSDAAGARADRPPGAHPGGRGARRPPALRLRCGAESVECVPGGHAGLQQRGRRGEPAGGRRRGPARGGHAHGERIGVGAAHRAGLPFGRGRLPRRLPAPQESFRRGQSGPPGARRLFPAHRAPAGRARAGRHRRVCRALPIPWPPTPM
jgi:hypothetical protein